MEIINVGAVVGEFCITLDAGDKVYDLITPYINQNSPIELDFTNVRVICTPFVNKAIGQLVGAFNADAVKRLLVINPDKITPVGLSLIQRVINNADEYYSNPVHRQAVDSVIGQCADSDNN